MTSPRRLSFLTFTFLARPISGLRRLLLTNARMVGRMMWLAKPPHIKRLRVVVMVSVSRRSAALLAWLSFKATGFKGLFHSPVRAALLTVLRLPRPVIAGALAIPHPTLPFRRLFPIPGMLSNVFVAAGVRTESALTSLDGSRGAVELGSALFADAFDHDAILARS